MKLKAKLAVAPVWGWSGLTLVLFFLVFGTSLALHLLTLPARSAPTLLTVPEQSLPVSTKAASISTTQSKLASSTSTPAVEAPSLLIPLGLLGQSIVQGEFGLLVDKFEQLKPTPDTETLLLAVHVHLTNFQGSYYKVRSLAGSTFLLKPTLNPGSASSSISSLTVSSKLARQPALDLASKTNMQFGDIASGWITFELSTATAGLANQQLEFQFIPGNTNIPIRVRLAGSSH